MAYRYRKHYLKGDLDIDIEKVGWKRGRGGDNLCHAAPTNTTINYILRKDVRRNTSDMCLIIIGISIYVVMVKRPSSYLIIRNSVMITTKLARHDRL